jgi:hypothetical protein
VPSIVVFCDLLRCALALQSVAFELRFGADIERLYNAGVNGGDHIHGAVQVMFRDAGFPCVRKATFDSRLAVAHRGNGQPHQDLLAFTEVRYRVCIAVKLSKVSFIYHGALPSSLAILSTTTASLRHRLPGCIMLELHWIGQGRLKLPSSFAWVDNKFIPC